VLSQQSRRLGHGYVRVPSDPKLRISNAAEGKCRSALLSDPSSVTAIAAGLPKPTSGNLNASAVPGPVFPASEPSSMTLHGHYRDPHSCHDQKHPRRILQSVGPSRG